MSGSEEEATAEQAQGGEQEEIAVVGKDEAEAKNGGGSGSGSGSSCGAAGGGGLTTSGGGGHGGGWPTLFEEVAEMTIASIGAFAIADLRALSRRGKLLESSDRVFDLPLGYDEILSIMQANDSAYRRTKAGDFHKLIDTYEHVVSEVREGGFSYGTNGDHIAHYVGDERAEEECVYALSSNAGRKRIVLAFRGSITVNDWLKDAKTVIGPVPNPVAGWASSPDDDVQSETVGMHLGFRDYLYGEEVTILSGTGDDETDDSSKEKKRTIFDKISLPKKPSALSSRGISEAEKEDEGEGEAKETKIEKVLRQLRALMDEFPDYKVYITGHSLGGALALCTALEASAALGTPAHPVTCITVGNPKAGDFRFRSAIELLERRGLLRCLCVHNKGDFIPLLPDHFVTGQRNFCHVGMEMRLFKTGYQILRKGGDDDTLGRKASKDLHEALENFKTGGFLMDRFNKHNYRLYYERTLAQREELTGLYLNDLYREKLDVSFA